MRWMQAFFIYSPSDQYNISQNRLAWERGVSVPICQLRELDWTPSQVKGYSNYKPCILYCCAICDAVAFSVVYK